MIAHVSDKPAAPIFRALVMEPKGSSEILVPIFQTTQHHIPENLNIHC
jgi:hypothetical protein